MRRRNWHHGGSSHRARLAGTLATLAVLLPLLAACSEGDGKTLPPPKPRPSPTTATTKPIDYAQVAISPIAGVGPTTSTRPPGPGQATIAGRVVDEYGAPVAGAFVRTIYFNDPAKPEVIEVLSGEDGSYRFEQLYGGRWRIRAWQTPLLATFESLDLFLGATEQKTQDLKVQATPALAVSSRMAPDRPFIGASAELAVLVFNQTVNSDGAVARTAAAGTSVTLSVTGSWSLQTPITVTADETGRASWTLVCGAEGVQDISAIAGTEVFPLTLPSCLDPVSTSTTIGSGSSTTSSTKPKSKVSPTTSTTQFKSLATTTTRPRSTTTRPR